jgi:hypothetical protein
MKMKNITKWLAATTVFGLLCLASQRADAVLQMSYTGDSQYLVGTVIPTPSGAGNGGQPQRDIDQTNMLEGMYTGVNNQTTTGTGTNQDPFILWSRTTWPHGPDATSGITVVANDMTIVNGIVQITLTQAYQYLVGSYDGSSGGTAVWDISSFHAGDTIQIYAYASVEGGLQNPTGNLIGSDHNQQGYRFITSFSLLNPLGGVPDGGTTVMLLGMGLGALGMVRRYLTR